jgi:hypothetical protein
MPHPHKSFSAGGDEVADDKVGAGRLPPVTYRAAQQTPLGEWPLVAA